jgi:hypothetical protein
MSEYCQFTGIVLRLRSLHYTLDSESNCSGSNRSKRPHFSNYKPESNNKSLYSLKYF